MQRPWARTRFTRRWCSFRPVSSHLRPAFDAGRFFHGRSDKSQILISVKIPGARRRRRMVLLTRRKKKGGSAMKRLADKVAIVTGGSRGIGGATVKRFVEEGSFLCTKYAVAP